MGALSIGPLSVATLVSARSARERLVSARTGSKTKSRIRGRKHEPTPARPQKGVSPVPNPPKSKPPTSTPARRTTADKILNNPKASTREERAAQDVRNTDIAKRVGERESDRLRHTLPSSSGARSEEVPRYADPKPATQPGTPRPSISDAWAESIYGRAKPTDPTSDLALKPNATLAIPPAETPAYVPVGGPSSPMSTGSNNTNPVQGGFSSEALSDTVDQVVTGRNLNGTVLVLASNVSASHLVPHRMGRVWETMQVSYTNPAGYNRYIYAKQDRDRNKFIRLVTSTAATVTYFMVVN